MKTKINSSDIEILVMDWVSPRINLAVSNVSWGLINHEADVLVLTKAGFLWEFEIKVSKADLIQDKLKTKWKYVENSKMLKRFYYVFPEKLLDAALEHTPEYTGLIIVQSNLKGKLILKQVREPKTLLGKKMTDLQKFKFARLGALRILPMKKSLKRYNQYIENMRKQ